jgi:hypothetical protein
LENTQSFTDKPTKTNPKEFDIKNLPLAGRLSEVGQKILSLGGKKASHITTMNWGVGYPEET